MGTQKTSLQKTYEINIWQDSIDVEFLEENRHFHCLEIFLVHEKSEKHTTIYNSYNREMATQEIKFSKLTNFTEACSLTK